MKYLIIILFIFQVAFAQQKFDLYCQSYLIEASRDSLFAQVGIKELTGHNDGETLKYQKIFGLRNQPYCAMGQYWCYWANAKDKVDIPFRKSANAQSYYNYAQNYGVKTKYQASIDDFIVWMISKTINGHIERIIKVGEAGWVVTIGFNTSNGKLGKQREGNGVFERKRNIYYPIGRLLIKGLVGIKSINRNDKQGCNEY